MWAFEVTNLAGISQGELLNAHNRKLRIPMGAVPSASCSIRGDHPLAAYIRANDFYLKAYDAGDLRYHGLATSIEDEADDNGYMIKVVSGGPAWRLKHRLAGKSAKGTSLSGDRAVIFRTLISTTNGESDTGIRTTNLSVGSGSSVSGYIAGPYKPVYDCGQELANSLDGFDWEVVPIEYSAGKIGDFKAAAVFGSTRTEAIFEWGCGRGNVRSWRRTKVWETLANRAFHIADEGPNAPNLPVKSATDSTSMNARGLYETIAEAAGLTNATMRDQLVQEHVNYRKVPRLVYQIRPDFSGARVPRFRTDYDLGDFIPFRTAHHGVKMFNVLARVYAVEVEVNDEGQASVQPIISPEETEQEVAA